MPAPRSATKRSIPSSRESPSHRERERACSRGARIAESSARTFSTAGCQPSPWAKALLHDSLAELENVRAVVVAGDVEDHALLDDPSEGEIGDKDLLAAQDPARSQSAVGRDDARPPCA